jgi:hypothetical protein
MNACLSYLGFGPPPLGQLQHALVLVVVPAFLHEWQQGTSSAIHRHLGEAVQPTVFAAFETASPSSRHFGPWARISSTTSGVSSISCSRECSNSSTSTSDSATTVLKARAHLLVHSLSALMAQRNTPFGHIALLIEER